MAKCVKVLRRRKQFCIGQMDTQIKLQNRAITSPLADSVDFGEEFSDDNTVWAWVQTVRGRTVFDSTNIERVVTHEVGIRYIEGITQETWFDLDGELYDIIDVEDIDERHEFLGFDAAVRGDRTKSVNLA